MKGLNPHDLNFDLNLYVAMERIMPEVIRIRAPLFGPDFVIRMGYGGA